jgi:hypothetical protein
MVDRDGLPADAKGGGFGRRLLRRSNDKMNG